MGCGARAGSAAFGGDDEAEAASEDEAAGEDEAGDPALAGDGRASGRSAWPATMAAFAASDLFSSEPFGPSVWLSPSAAAAWPEPQLGTGWVGVGR